MTVRCTTMLFTFNFTLSDLHARISPCKVMLSLLLFRLKLVDPFDDQASKLYRIEQNNDSKSYRSPGVHSYGKTAMCQPDLTNPPTIIYYE